MWIQYMKRTFEHIHAHMYTRTNVHMRACVHTHTHSQTHTFTGIKSVSTTALQTQTQISKHSYNPDNAAAYTVGIKTSASKMILFKSSRLLTILSVKFCLIYKEPGNSLRGPVRPPGNQRLGEVAGWTVGEGQRLWLVPIHGACWPHCRHAHTHINILSSDHSLLTRKSQCSNQWTAGHVKK